MVLDKKFRHHLAVVVGINDYRNGIPSLKTPVNDAETLAALLQQKHGHTVELLLDEKAGLTALRNLLETELPQRLTQDDRLLFYFAGHGIALNGEDGPEGYLIPYGAKLGDISTYLPMAQVNQALLKLPCRHFLGILDCCFAGAFRWSNTRKLAPAELGTIYKERFDRFITDSAWQVITSAASDQVALDAFDLTSTRRGFAGNHSPFAAALIEALQGEADAFPRAEPDKPAGDGVITATELYLYVRDRVELGTEACPFRQTPNIHPLMKHDKGEYIFLSPVHPLNLPPAPELDGSSNPYRGLESFDEVHRDLFFGRQTLTQALAEFVTNHALTVVLGASGSGKSSLVKAGLLPQLRQAENWQILPAFRPGESPFKALNQVLASINQPAIAAADPTASQLLAPDQHLSSWFQEHPQSHLVVVVDQLEELITLCQDTKERQQFLAMLAKAIASYPTQLHLVLTLRSDFEPQFRNTALEQDWQGARFIVPAMTRDELRQAIEAPASARVMYFDPHQLVDQLIDEVANMPGALPLLSFALSELYLNYLKRQEAAKLSGETVDRAMTQADYDQLGGVTRSLTQRAEQEYQSLVQLDSAYEQTIRNVMLRMVSVGGELARRRVPLLELEYPESEAGRVKTAIQHFETVRLLTSGTDTENLPYVEPAHDVLIRGWQRLLEWRQTGLASLVLQRELYPRAERWQQEQGNPRAIGLLWTTDPRLPQLRQLLKPENREQNWLNQTEIKFVQRSSQRKTTNQRRLVGSVTTVILALSGLTAFAFIQQGIATQNAATAQRNEQRANQQTELAQQNAATAQRNADRANREAGRANQQATLARQNAATAQRNEQRANQQAELARQNAATAQRNEQRANQQTELAINNQKLAEYRATIAQLREQSARVLNLLPTANAVPGLILAIDTLAQSESVPVVEIAAQANLLSGVQVSQEVNRLQGHESWVSSVAFSSDGRHIVSGSWDRTLRIWDAQTNQPLGPPLQGHGDRVNSVAFSPDGQRIVSGSDDKTVRLWDAETGQPLAPPLQGHQDPVWSVAFSPNGRQIVSGGSDKTIRLWDAETGQPLGPPLQGHEDRVNSVAFSPDGQRIVSGSRDKTLRFWDAQTSQPLGHPLQSPEGSITSVAFSPDGKRLVSGGGDNTVRLWEVETGQPIGSPFRGHGAAVLSVAFSPDGKRIVSGSDDNTLRLWDVETGQPIGHPQISENRVDAVVFSPDGQRIVSGGWEKTLRLWDAQMGQPMGRVVQTHEDAVNSVAFSPDGRRIVSVSIDSTLRIWDPQTGESIGPPLQNPDSVLSAAFSPDGNRLVTGSQGATLQLWDVETGQAMGPPLQGHEHIILSVAFSPDGKRLVSGSFDETVRIWDAETGQPVGQPLQGHEAQVMSVAFSPNGNRIVSVSLDDTVRVWDAKTGQPVGKPFQGHGNLVNSVAFSPDSQHIVSGSGDGTVRLWNAETGQPIGPPLYGHGASVNGVAFSPDGKRMVSGGDDKMVRLWDAQTGQPIGYPLQGHGDTVFAVAFSPDSQRIISGGSDKTVRLWDVAPESWLAIGCNRLQHHPMLTQPETVIGDPALIQVAQRTQAVCQQRVWQRSPGFARAPTPWVKTVFRQIASLFGEGSSRD